jgi:hypothetical protein
VVSAAVGGGCPTARSVPAAEDDLRRRERVVVTVHGRRTSAWREYSVEAEAGVSYTKQPSQI